MIQAAVRWRATAVVDLLDIFGGADDSYTLHSNSPFAAESNPPCGLIRARDIECGSTPVEAASWGAIKGMFR